MPWKAVVSVLGRQLRSGTFPARNGRWAGLSVPELRRRRFIGKGEMENPWAIAESLERD